MKANNSFWRQVHKTDHCWHWTGQVTNGYGTHYQDKRSWLTHRLVVLDSGREIPTGYDVDHLCRNKLCVNPAHVDPVSKSDHAKRGWPYAHRQYWKDRLDAGIRHNIPDAGILRMKKSLAHAELLVADMDLILDARIHQITQQLDEMLPK